MRRTDLHSMTVDQLAEQFVSIALDQDEALFKDQISRFNRLHHQMKDVVNELKSRPGDQRSILLPLYTHRNIQVRLKAARTTIDVAPKAAREVFQKIVDSRRYPQAADALAAIWRLDGRPIVPQ
jgi:cytochrome c oxidase assembly protein Cox11